MTPNVLTLREEDNLLNIQNGMNEFGMRHLPVVDGRKPVGLISHRDVLRMTRSSLRDRILDKALDSQKQEKCFVAEVMTSPDNSPLSPRLACYSLSQRFCLPHKYNQYSLSHQKHCDNE